MPSQRDVDRLANFLATISQDPYQFVLLCFPWGHAGTELENHTGPDVWQETVLKEIRDGLRNPDEVIREAVASGHGTGKSCLVSWIILWAMSTMPDCRGVITANTETQLKTKTWAELSKWHRLFIGEYMFIVTATSMYSSDPKHERTWRMDAVPWSEKNPQAFAGLHNKNKRILLIFDEAADIADIIWETAEGALTDSETEIIWGVFGNPSHNNGRFRNCFGRFKHRWKTHHVDGRKAKVSNKKLYEEWQSDHGIDSDFFKIRVLGQFPDASSGQFIPIKLAEDAASVERDIQATVYDPLIMGVDVARSGPDASVIRFRRGRDARSIPPIKYRGSDTMEFAAMVAAEYELHRPDAVFIDVGGPGGGVIDRCRQLNVPAIEVAFGARALSGRGNDTYYNLRAQMWGLMRDWLKSGMIDNDRDLIDGMTSVQYDYRALEGIDAIILERKSEMRARGLPSPDDVDALCFVGSTLVMTPNGPRTIESLRVGDAVVTPFSVARIAVKWTNETESLTTARFTDGSCLRGTGKHEVFCWGSGVKRLDALTLTDRMEPYTKRRLRAWRLLSLLSTRSKNTGFRRLVDTISLAGTTTPSAFFIAAFGQITMALSQKGLRFIIWIVTGATTRSATSSFEWRANTSVNTCLSGVGTTRSITASCCDTWMSSERQPPSGTPRMLEGRGTACMASRCGTDGSQSMLLAPNAERGSLPSSQAGRSTAQPPASSRSLIGVISRRLGPVRGVASRFWQIVTGKSPVVPRSVATENVSPTVVYNLTLDRDNAYYANGLLVFNCLTFAMPVQPRDHTAMLTSRLRSTHQSDYNPMAEAWKAGRGSDQGSGRNTWMPHGDRWIGSYR